MGVIPEYRRRNPVSHNPGMPQQDNSGEILKQSIDQADSRLMGANGRMMESLEKAGNAIAHGLTYAVTEAVKAKQRQDIMYSEIDAAKKLSEYDTEATRITLDAQDQFKDDPDLAEGYVTEKLKDMAKAQSEGVRNPITRQKLDAAHFATQGEYVRKTMMWSRAQKADNAVRSTLDTRDEFIKQAYAIGSGPGDVVANVTELVNRFRGYSSVTGRSVYSGAQSKSYEDDGVNSIISSAMASAVVKDPLRIKAIVSTDNAITRLMDPAAVKRISDMADVAAEHITQQLDMGTVVDGLGESANLLAAIKKDPDSSGRLINQMNGYSEQMKTASPEVQKVLARKIQLINFAITSSHSDKMGQVSVADDQETQKNISIRLEMLAANNGSAYSRVMELGKIHRDLEDAFVGGKVGFSSYQKLVGGILPKFALAGRELGPTGGLDLFSTDMQKAYKKLNSAITSVGVTSESDRMRIFSDFYDKVFDASEIQRANLKVSDPEAAKKSMESLIKTNELQYFADAVISRFLEDENDGVSGLKPKEMVNLTDPRTGRSVLVAKMANGLNYIAGAGLKEATRYNPGYNDPDSFESRRGLMFSNLYEHPAPFVAKVVMSGHNKKSDKPGDDNVDNS